MAEAVAGVHFDLGANSVQLQKDLAQAAKHLQAFAHAGDLMGKAIGTALAGLGTAVLGSFAQESVRAAAAVARLADRAGVSTAAFQQLANAFRTTGVGQEEMAQGLAKLGANLSDLQSGTGPFLQFLRQSAPALIDQFRAATNTSDALAVLADATAGLATHQDRVRLTTAAAGEAFAKLVPILSQGRSALNDASNGFIAINDAAARRAQEIEDRWNTLWTNLRNLTVQGVVAVYDAIAGEPARQRLAALDKQIALIATNMGNLTAAGLKTDAAQRLLTASLGDYARQWAELNRNTAHLDFGATATGALGRGIKEVQAELSLFLAQLDVLPRQSEFVSSRFVAAWDRMREVMTLNGAKEQEIQAARINLLRQEQAARDQVLGGALTRAEELRRKEQELNDARVSNLISEAEHLRRLADIMFQYRDAQLSTAQSLGANISINEQYQASVERINAALARGAITAQMGQRAMTQAAIGAASSYAAAFDSIGQNIAAAFEDNKALASASVIISTLAAAIKALEVYGPTPLGFAAAAAATAAGVANLAKINSTSINSTSIGGGAPAAVSVPASAPPTSLAPSQSLEILLPAGRYSDQEIKAIIEGINDGVRNGVTLISTKVMP
jgi:hypothetical protein